jgi:hypothetical protein
MDEFRKRDAKKGELPYLDGVQNIHNKHMELLTDLMQHPTLRTDIPDITEIKDILLNNNLLHTELEPPFKKTRKQSEETTDNETTN